MVFSGKLYADTLEGSLRVKAEDAVLKVLNPVGEVTGEIAGEKQRMESFSGLQAEYEQNRIEDLKKR